MRYSPVRRLLTLRVSPSTVTYSRGSCTLPFSGFPQPYVSELIAAVIGPDVTVMSRLVSAGPVQPSVLYSGPSATRATILLMQLRLGHAAHNSGYTMFISK